MPADPLTQALARLAPELIDGEFVLVAYERGQAPPTPDALAAEAFSVRIDDAYETTFCLRSDLADALPAPAARSEPLRVITVGDDKPGGWGRLVSTISGALAERNIPAVTIRAASHDHILVAVADWPQVLAILRGLRDAARSLPGLGRETRRRRDR
jgi:hypothetical protein